MPNTGIRLAQNAWRAGYYHSPQRQAAAGLGGGGAWSPATGYLYLHPICMGAGQTMGITKIAHCAADATADNFLTRVGIYEADSNWDLSLLYDAGTIAKGTEAALSFVTSSAGTFTEVVMGPKKNYVVAVGIDVARSAGGSLWYHGSPATASPFGNPWGFPDTYTSANDTPFRAGPGYLRISYSTGSLPSTITEPNPVNGSLSDDAAPTPYLYISSVG